MKSIYESSFYNAKFDEIIYEGEVEPNPCPSDEFRYINVVQVPESYKSSSFCGRDVSNPGNETDIINYPEPKCQLNVEIPPGTKVIREEAYIYCDNMKNLTLPDSLEEIQARAFYNCKYLVGPLTIPKNVKKIGDEAFARCISLTEIKIIDSPLSIGNGTFCECEKLKTVEFGKNVYEIGPYAFCKCKVLSGSLVIPSPIRNIEDYSFFECAGLTSLVLHSSIINIGNYSFKGCYSLSGEIVIDNWVTSIGDSAFYLCRGLTTLTVKGRNVERIGENAFRSCSFEGSL